MNSIFMEYDLNMLRAENEYSIAKDAYNITVTRLSNIMENAVDDSYTDDIMSAYFEAAGSFTESVKKFFHTILENIKKLCSAVVRAVQTKIAQHNVNAKLKDLKEQLKIIHFNGNDKVTMFDTAKYTKALTQYVNAVVKESKAVFSKQYDSVEAYEKAVRASNEKLDNLYKSLNLDSDAVFTINQAVPTAITYTEKEVNNITQIANAYQKMWETATIDLQNMAVSEDEPSRVAYIKNRASNLQTKCSSAFKKIINSPVTKVAAIAAVCATMGVLKMNHDKKRDNQRRSITDSIIIDKKTPSDKPRKLIDTFEIDTFQVEHRSGNSGKKVKKSVGKKVLKQMEKEMRNKKIK